MNAAGEVVSVTVTEPRFTVRDKAILLASRRKDMEPRGAHGILLSEATDIKNWGQFETEAIVDFAQMELNAARDARREQMGEGSDEDHLLWRIKQKGQSE